MLSRTFLVAFLVTSFMTDFSLAQTAVPDWVERSNENAQVLLNIRARFNPESAGQTGVEGLDEEITQLPFDLDDQRIAANEAALDTLKPLLDQATDQGVRQDLEILIEAAQMEIRDIELERKYHYLYFNLPQLVFYGIQYLLDEQIPEERRSAALVRLRKYVGTAEGYTPLVRQAEAYARSQLDTPGLRGPYIEDLEKDMANSDRFIAGIGDLFNQFGIEGFEDDYELLKEQIKAYNEFLQQEMVPRASRDYKLPRELYEFRLRQRGIDMPVDELVSRAKVTFREIQNEMQAIATLLAEERGYASSDYRDVIRELKKSQFDGDAILPHYEHRIAQLEELIRRENVLTLPDRKMHIRLASEAESAAIPAPHMRPPRMIGNTGEMGAFVLPLRIPSPDGESESGFDDFTFEAASWTLTVHEGRPGHELQFASMIEKGVSTARMVYAFNSVNVEGWALYAEAEMKPYLPLDGQLIALQHRLLRAARAFLDPGLQLGDIERDVAYRVLKEDVVLSDAMANQEVERYAFWSPGQAPSYFCGYQRLMEIRTDVERVLGPRFDKRALHDFILGQGMLPPALLRKAVMEEFVPSVVG